MRTILVVLMLASAQAQILTPIMGGSPGCAQSRAFISRLSTPPSAPLQSKYQDLICGLVTDGIWSTLDTLYTFSAPNQTDALKNLVSTSYTGTLTGSPTFTANVGFTGTGANGNYVDTHFNATTASTPKCVQDDCHVSVWSLRSASETASMFGTAANGPWTEISENLGATSEGRVFTVSGVGISTNDGYGFLSISHPSVGLTNMYKNGGESSAAATHTDFAPDNSDFVYLQGFWGASSGAVAAGASGASLNSTQVTNLYNRLRLFVSADLIVAHGDSITYGKNLVTLNTTAFPYPRLVSEQQYTTNGRVANDVNLGDPAAGFGYPGDSGYTLTQSAPLFVDQYAGVPGAQLGIWGGTNDMWMQLGDLDASATYALFQTYLAARIAAGWTYGRITVVTTLPRQYAGGGITIFAPRRNAYNALLVAGATTYGYKIARVDLDAMMGCDACCNNATYYNDTIHPTKAGDAIIGPIIWAAMFP